MASVAREIDNAKLEELLLAGADRLRRHVAGKIQSDLRQVISPEDVLQEVWIAAFRGMGSFRADRPDAFDRWMTLLVGRKLIDACRAARALKRGGGHRVVRVNPDRATSLEALFQRAVVPCRTPSREVAAAEARDAVQIALGALPENRRRALWMHHVEGWSLAETAEAMEKTPAAVNSLVFNGLRQLSGLLGRATRFFSDAPDDPEDRPQAG